MENNIEQFETLKEINTLKKYKIKSNIIVNRILISILYILIFCLIISKIYINSEKKNI